MGAHAVGVISSIGIVLRAVHTVGRLGTRLRLDASPRALHVVWLVSVVAVAAMLRFMLLDAKSLWFDEAFSVHAAGFSLREMTAFVVKVDAHPPGFYLLLHYWMRVFGRSETAIRSLSVIASLGTVWLSYLLGRRLAGASVGLIGALLIAIAPFQIMAAQEVRMYPWLEFLGVLSTYALWMALETGRRGFWGAYVGATAAMLYVHYFGFLVLGFHGLYVLAIHWRDHRVWKVYALVLLLVALLYVPWGRALLTHVSEGRGWAWFKTRFPPLDLLINTLALLFYGGYLRGGQTYFGGLTLPLRVSVPLLTPFLFLCAVGFRALYQDRRRALLVAGYLTVPLVTVVIASCWLTFAYPRYFAFLGPPVAVLLAAGIEACASRMPRGWSRATAVGLVLLVLAFVGPVLYGFYVMPQFEPYKWRDAARHIERGFVSSDAIVVYPGATRVALTYYLRRSNAGEGVIAVEIPRPGGRAYGYRPTLGHTSFTRDHVKQLWRQRRRIWLVMTVPTPEGSRERLLSAVDRYFDARDVRIFGQFVWVFLFEPRTEPLR